MVLILFAFIVSTKSVPSRYIFHVRKVHIYQCTRSEMLFPARVQNNRVVRYRPNGRNSVWEYFQSFADPSFVMFGIKKDQQWYFIQNVNNIFRIVKSKYPRGHIPSNDLRWFRFYSLINRNKNVIKHIATEAFMMLSPSRGKLVVATFNGTLATDLCIS